MFPKPGNMTLRNILLTFFFQVFFFNSLELIAQRTTGSKSLTPEEAAASRLFESDTILHFSLAGKLKELYKDISAKNSYHPILLQYHEKDGGLISIQLKAKTRGHFRKMKGMCTQPPLLLDFSKDGSTKNTVFENQSKLKLIVPCQGDDYVVKEFLCYKVYNLISPHSFRARLAMVDFVDSLNPAKTESHYCFLLEDEKPMAARNKSFVWKKKMLKMQSTEADEFRKMAVFEYLIGNTDWGIPYLQNIVLITKDTLILPIPVPYDFDHAGIVDAPYAGPAPELGISSDLVRLYRGYCENDMNNFASTFELYNRLKRDIYKVYDSCNLLSPKYVKFVHRFIDDFYKTINNKKQIDSEFGNPCRTEQHVEIKGLKK